MATFTKVNPNDPIQSHQLNQVIDALIGTSGQGVPVALTAQSDSLNFSLTVQNLDSVNSRALNVLKSDGTTLVRADASGVTLGAPLNVATGAIQAGALADGSVTSATIANGSVTGSDIAAGTITGTNIASSTITTGNIQDGTIQGTDIAAATITGAKVAASTITGSNIAASTITGTNIASGITLSSPTLTTPAVTGAASWASAQTFPTNTTINAAFPGTGLSFDLVITSSNYTLPSTPSSRRMLIFIRAGGSITVFSSTGAGSFYVGQTNYATTGYALSDGQGLIIGGWDGNWFAIAKTANPTWTPS